VQFSYDGKSLVSDHGSVLSLVCLRGGHRGLAVGVQGEVV
jgi:hypothetical protein